MKSLNDAKDIEFAYKVRRALNESVENIPEVTIARLSNARKIALSRKKQESTVAVFSPKGILARY